MDLSSIHTALNTSRAIVHDCRLELARLKSEAIACQAAIESTRKAIFETRRALREASAVIGR